MNPDLFWITGPWRGRLAIATRPRGGEWLGDEIRGWRRLDPIVPASFALLSIAASAGFYWELFRRMAE